MIKAFPVNANNFEKLTSPKPRQGIIVDKMNRKEAIDTIYASRSAAEADGLKYYWKFDEIEGTSAYDASTNEYHLSSAAGVTITNSITSDASLGQARNFNGSSSYLISLISVAKPTTKIIFGAVIKITTFKNDGILLAFGNSTQHITIGTRNAKLLFWWENGSHYHDYISSADIFTLNTTHFVLLEFNPYGDDGVVNSKLYIDGEQKNSQKQYWAGGAAVPSLIDSAWRTGVHRADNSNNFAGYIDEIFIFYDKGFSDLSITEADFVSAHCNVGKGKYLF